MVGFSIVITVLKLYTTPTPKYIKNTKTRQDASTYISLMKSSNPVIECHGYLIYFNFIQYYYIFNFLLFLGLLSIIEELENLIEGEGLSRISRR